MSSKRTSASVALCLNSASDSFVVRSCACRSPSVAFSSLSLAEQSHLDIMSDIFSTIDQLEGTYQLGTLGEQHEGC